MIHPSLRLMEKTVEILYSTLSTLAGGVKKSETYWKSMGYGLKLSM